MINKYHARYMRATVDMTHTAAGYFGATVRSSTIRSISPVVSVAIDRRSSPYVAEITIAYWTTSFVGAQACPILR